MTSKKTCESCSDTTCQANAKRPGEDEAAYLERQAVSSRMCQIKQKLLVLSGKGGVGKSTVAVNLAATLATAGKQMGLLDIDIHGPSVPQLLHIKTAQIVGDEDGMCPVTVRYGEGKLYVMSIGFLLPGRDDAVIWRGPRKFGLIRQFLRDVSWGELDYLVVDSPPGTGDEPLAVVELIEDADGAVIVTTPQQVAVQDVRRCVRFCRELDLPVLGVVENMSGFICPRCGEQLPILGSDGGRKMAEELGVPYLGPIPLETDVVASGEQGRPIVESHPHSATAIAFGRIARQFLEPDLEAAEAQLMPSS